LSPSSASVGQVTDSAAAAGPSEQGGTGGSLPVTTGKRGRPRRRSLEGIVPVRAHQAGHMHSHGPHATCIHMATCTLSVGHMLSAHVGPTHSAPQLPPVLWPLCYTAVPVLHVHCLRCPQHCPTQTPRDRNREAQRRHRDKQRVRGGVWRCILLCPWVRWLGTPHRSVEVGVVADVGFGGS
jgi:hypothetical protein